MNNLREILIKEQQRLEKILQETETRLEKAPQGTLRLSRSGKNVQYYLCRPEYKKNGEYISKTEEDFIRSLAQKSYDEKVVKLAARRLRQIRGITGDYKDNEMEKLFLNEHRERLKLIHPVEPTWDQQLEKWMNEKYEGKDFQKEDPVIVTDRGERVRSKSEKILADYFYKNGIPYKYEKPLYLKGFGFVHPDFTFLSPETRQEIYWEHHGRMDDPRYVQSTVKKIQAYEENNIFPGERLILTFETEKIVLNTRMIERMATRYLLGTSV